MFQSVFDKIDLKLHIKQWVFLLGPPVPLIPSI